MPNVKGKSSFGLGWKNYNFVAPMGAFVQLPIPNKPDGFRHDSSASGSDDANGVYELNLSHGQTNSDGTYLPENQATYKDGGIVRPSNITIKVWKRIN